MVCAKEYWIVFAGLLSTSWVGSMVEGYNLRHTHSTTQQENNSRRYFQENEQQQQHRQEEEYTEEDCPSSKWNQYWWVELPDDIQENFRILGYNADIWDNNRYVVTDHFYWDDLSSQQRRAAQYLGWDKNMWNNYELAPWSALPIMVRRNAQTLGYTADLWDNHGTVFTDNINWDDLTRNQVRAAEFFGWDRECWNNFGVVDHPRSPPNTSTTRTSTPVKEYAREFEIIPVPNISGVATNNIGNIPVNSAFDLMTTLNTHANGLNNAPNPSSSSTTGIEAKRQFSVIGGV